MLFNRRHGGGCAYEGVPKEGHNKLITMFRLKTSKSGNVRNTIPF
jgi:hypothetical protein